MATAVSVRVPYVNDLKNQSEQLRQTSTTMHLHQNDNVHDKQECQSSGPPSALLDSAVVAPSTETSFGSYLRSLAGFLTSKELLQINPLSLRIGQQRRPRPRPEVGDDDAKSKWQTGMSKRSRHV